MNLNMARASKKIFGAAIDSAQTLPESTTEDELGIGFVKVLPDTGSLHFSG